MESIHQAIYKMIKASALEKGMVDMPLLFGKLREECVELEYYYETVSMLEQQGLLEVLEGAELCLTKNGYVCSTCRGIVHGPWSEHRDDCRRRQREQKQRREDIALRAKMAENKASAQW